MITYDLSGRTALVTGSNRGIGKAMADALEAAGAQVVRTSSKDCDLSNYQQVLNPGDIIFCSYGHVAIYIGGEYMIHAPYPGQYVCVAWVYDCIGGGFGG